MANKIVTDEIRKLIGSESKPHTVEVERGAIRRFAEAIGDSSPQFNDEQAARLTQWGGMIAPPTFGRSLGGGFFGLQINMPVFRALDGGSEWEYFEPLRPGDRITVISKLADIREAAGRLGPMVFIVTETRYTNQFGQLCIVQRSTGIRY
jgi:acyl dehydratase